MWPHVTGFLAPSAWAAGVLRSYVARLGEELGPRAVSLWPHGVEAQFLPNAFRHEERKVEFTSGEFRVLHVASSRAERKGTAQLVEAWCSLIDEARIGARAQLRLVLDEPHAWPKDVERTAARFIRQGDPRSTIRVIPRQGAAPEEMRAMLQAHHVVCQPSRGEGFGLVPLEARACGVPVVMTDCTGHEEHTCGVPELRELAERGERRLALSALGVVVVEHGAPAPIDDGPGATAPSVSPMAVARALEHAYAAWPKLASAAYEAAAGVGEQWSWAAVTERWLKEKRA